MFGWPLAALGGVELLRWLGRGGVRRLLTHFAPDGKKARQLGRRGWMREAIDETVNNRRGDSPFLTKVNTCIAFMTQGMLYKNCGF